MNTFINRKSYSGPNNSFDYDATITRVARLIDSDCAARPEGCVRAVIDVVNSTTSDSRVRAVEAYRATPACVAG